jgi:hypothetical protein
MRRRAAARKKLNTKKTLRLVYNTKYLQIYQIWRLKQPINQLNKVPAPSLAKQIKYGLPYLIDLFDAECDKHDGRTPIPNIESVSSSGNASLVQSRHPLISALLLLHAICCFCLRHLL